MQLLTWIIEKHAVGGGSDGIYAQTQGETAELKATEHKGQTKEGEEKSHSVSVTMEHHTKTKLLR